MYEMIIWLIIGALALIGNEIAKKLDPAGYEEIERIMERIEK